MGGDEDDELTREGGTRSMEDGATVREIEAPARPLRTLAPLDGRGLGRHVNRRVTGSPLPLMDSRPVLIESGCRGNM